MAWLPPISRRCVIVNVGKARGAYQRLLECGESRFDRGACGDEPEALSASERRGASPFVGKAKCVECHSGPRPSDEKFHEVGLKPELAATVFIDMNERGASVGLAAALNDSLNSKGIFSDQDDGRLQSELPSQLEGAFRTPKLRCISKRPSFMHTAHLRTLEDVVAFFDPGRLSGRKRDRSAWVICGPTNGPGRFPVVAVWTGSGGSDSEY